MRFNYLFKMLKRHNLFFKPILLKTRHTNLKIHNISLINKKFCTMSPSNLSKFSEEHTEHDNAIEADPDYLEDYNYEMDQGYAKDLLYNKNTKDLLLSRIYNCVSVQELFNVLNMNLNQFRCEHLVLTVLVLYDFKTIFHEVNGNSVKLSNEFLQQLRTHKHFQNLLSLIEQQIHFFSSESLSYILKYLTKLGLKLDESLPQTVCEELKYKLEKKFEISPTARYLEAVFNEPNLKSYYQAQNLIPQIYATIDGYSLINELSDLTTCLNKLHNIISSEILNNYSQKVNDLIEYKKITSKDYKLVVKIISFLNFPKWRDKSTVIISKCALLLKGNFNKLNVNELVMLYESMFKTQEPGAVLNDLQRCSSKYLQETEDMVNSQKIKLFAAIIFFSAPSLRPQFQKSIKKYIDNCNNIGDLISMRRIMSHLKISDSKLCQEYWTKILELYQNDPESIEILALTENYMNFNIDLDNYRNYNFEIELLKNLDLVARNKYWYLPQKLCHILSFVMIYGNDKNLFEFLVSKLEADWVQYNHVDCLQLTLSHRLCNHQQNKYLKLPFLKRIDTVLDKIIEKEAAKSEQRVWKINWLMKSCIHKTNTQLKTFDKLLQSCVKIDHFCSKFLENTTYVSLNTTSLIPELIDQITEYITSHKEHVLGFNIEKILYLCFWLGYHPKKNSDEFFETCTNIIIRDQERMGGLSLIHAALSLCFFHKLPHSLIKSIFNEEFLDKLDMELENCYSKDKYPQRVRHNMMQLNRAVCLDYPESNVPWFHQKYIDELLTKSSRNMRRNKIFPSRVKEYLIQTVHKSEAVLENVTTPYGYDIDFVINLDEQGKVVTDSSRATKKLAILLVPQYAYTRINVQLRGRYQLKNRHLEMLGYTVVMINFTDWISLFFAADRKEFLSNLIWPKKMDNYNEATVR